MSDRTPAAFMTSLALHGLVVAVMFLVAYSSSFDTKVATKPFELVMGEGDNFAATEAAALGTPGGIKLNVPPLPAPEPPKPEVAKVEPTPAPPEPAPVVPPAPEPKPTPVKETPKPAAPTKSGNTKTKSIADEMRWKTIVEESKAKQQIAKQRAAEKKRLEQERQEEARRVAAAAKAPRVDAEGIAKGVLGGSTSNTKGGAGGTAMTRPDGPALEAYFGMLRERLLRALDKPPGLSDTLVAVAEFRIGADGAITGAKIISSSGSAEFDRAVLDAYSRVSMPPRPDKKSSVESLTFRTKDLAGG